MNISPARRWCLFALVVTAGVLNYVDRQLIAVLKPLIEKDVGWTDRDYGLLASLFQFSAALAFIFTGRIADWLGVKWANPFGVIAWSIAAMTHAWARTLAQFALCRIALGATEAMGTPTAIKTIATIFPQEQRSTGHGVLQAFSTMGAIITPLMIPPVALLVGWRGAFIIAGIAGLIWAGGWLVVTRGMRFDAEAKVGAPDTRPRYGQIIRDRRTWAISGAKALSDQTWWLLLFWAPDFFHRNFGLSVSELGPPLAVVYACAALGSFVSGLTATRLLKRGFSVNAVRKGSMLLAGVLVLPVPFALYVDEYWAAVGLLGLTLAAHQCFSVNLFALITDVTPPSKVGTVTSFAALIGNLAGMNILFLAGVLLTEGYGYLPLLLIASVSYLLALAWIHLLLPVVRKVGDVGDDAAPSKTITPTAEMQGL